MLLLIAMIASLSFALASVPIWPWSQRWNYYPSAASGLVAVSLAVLINFGVVF